ncbi:uncharacterized protein LOC125756932 [Rhipicephalus sanguineus]|uniref:uncharacterized protein LOC125756932 n=1 Tax=Rhipicephalus sanguineus TaxID=34632 RepID=UPI0020C53BA7|nr:uncharacterized protein LOC125756932 [Rhipicephalus sanguineus]
MSVHVSWGHVTTSGYGGGALSVSTWKQNFGLLGDSSYTLEPWFLTPVPGRPARGTPDDHYNKAHTAIAQCCGVVHRCKLVHSCSSIIAACAALHDIALAAHEPVLEGNDDDTDDADCCQQQLSYHHHHHHNGSQQQRNRVVNLFRELQGLHA